MLRDLIDGRYRVEQEVGRGGMGIVLRAFDTRLNRPVALKILSPDATHHPDRLRRFAAEARAASVLNHPGIATVYDFVEQGTDSFIVYEYIDGRTLRNELAHNRFTIDDVVGIGIQLADALIAAHSRGITHRDLKPENIMLVPDDHSRGRVKILDFGLAKQRPEVLSAGTESGAETISIATVPGLLIGTITYMAPEQVESRTTDERTDIYALGLVLYEMATRGNPFAGRTPPSTIANILKQEPPPLRQKDPATPTELDRILLKCLRKNPNERYQSTRELLVAFAISAAICRPSKKSKQPHVDLYAVSFCFSEPRPSADGKSCTCGCSCGACSFFIWAGDLRHLLGANGASFYFWSNRHASFS